MILAGRSFCILDGGYGGWTGFAGDVAAARLRLDGVRAICNLAPTRYELSVGLAAAMLEGVATILPPSRAEKAVGAAIGDTGGVAVIGDAPGPASRLPRLTGLAGTGETADPDALRRALGEAPGEVFVFTSGSTGRPVRHVKTWHTLAGGAALTRDLVARAGLAGQGTSLLGTTPHQHMYGLEATIFAALACGLSILDTPVFYPADLERAAALAGEGGAERVVLVTSPAHLRFLADTIPSIPSIRAVISATAPLPQALAQRLETEAEIPVLEIYGSTETGSMAWRRTVEDQPWAVLDGFVLTYDENTGTSLAMAPHLPEPAPMGDIVAPQPDGRFRLVGRQGDMVNIAGKRQSLGALNAILPDAPGLVDGAFVLERRKDSDVLIALVVPTAGPECNPVRLREAIRSHLAAHFDPAFSPRRILLVDALPRGATGKIPDAALTALMARHGKPR